MRMLIAALIALAPAAAAAQDAPKPPKQASILFRTGGAVKEWRAYAANVVYLLDRSKKWYRADLNVPCVPSGYDGGLGFLSRQNDAPIDRFTRVALDDGRVCSITSLIKEEPPQDRAPIAGNTLVR